MELDSWLCDNLVCPRDGQCVCLELDELACPNGHRYPIIDGIPVMLLREVRQTQWVATRSLEQADKKHALTNPEVPRNTDAVDAFVQQAIGATNGIMYKSLIGKLKEYPIPGLRAQKSKGDYFLDVGCNWGRWCIAASKLGYKPVGIDPNIDAIHAARRVAQQFGVQARYVVADARYLPFAENTFDLVFSYSVLQHFDKADVRSALSAIRRVLKIGGRSMIQMPNVFGLRCLYHQTRRGFRAAKDFDVRYWPPSELISTFGNLIGPVILSVDGYLSVNPQPCEAYLLPWRYRIVVHLSECLRRVSTKVPFMVYVADSLYVTAVKV